MPKLPKSLSLGGHDNDEKVEHLIVWIEDLKRDLEIPISIQAAGVQEAEFLSRLDHIAMEAFDDQCTGANPRYPLIDELRSILLDSYYGRPFNEFARPRSDRAGKRFNDLRPRIVKRPVCQ
jgi:acetaldehyde dehydrogenase/alcohol dehydrogenase